MPYSKARHATTTTGAVCVYEEATDARAHKYRNIYAFGWGPGLDRPVPSRRVSLSRHPLSTEQFHNQAASVPPHAEPFALRSDQGSFSIYRYIYREREVTPAHRVRFPHHFSLSCPTLSAPLSLSHFCFLTLRSLSLYPLPSRAQTNLVSLVTRVWCAVLLPLSPDRGTSLFAGEIPLGH